MSNRAKKTEHAGHKGSTRKTGYWGLREDAKRESNSARRLADRRIAQAYDPDDEGYPDNAEE